MATPPTAAETTALLTLHSKILTLISTTDPTSYQLPPHLQGRPLRLAIYSMLSLDRPDAACLRFLRANKLDPSAAFKQYLAHLRWRTCHMGVSALLSTGEVGALLTEKRLLNPKTKADKADKAEAEGFLLQLRKGKSYVRGTDREGRPIVWIRVRLHRGADQTVSSLERFATWNIETTRFLFADGVDSALLFFDMTLFGLANMDYTPLKFILLTLTNYYPLGLGSIVIHNPPWLFHACWRVVKAWNIIPPESDKHIHFTKGVGDLEALIDRRWVPRDMGGEDDWVWRYEEPEALPGVGLLQEERGERGEGKGKDHPGCDGDAGALGPAAEEEKDRLWDARLEVAARFERNTQDWIDAVAVAVAAADSTAAAVAAAVEGDEKEEKKKKKKEVKRQMKSRDDETILNEREEIGKELVLAYWRLDPLIRARSVYDRWGWVRSPLDRDRGSA